MFNLTDVPVHNGYDQKAYDYCVNYLKQYFGHGDVARYCMSNGKTNVPCTNIYCHAQWYSCGGTYKRQGWLIATAFNTPKDEETKEYLNFFVKESIFSRFILNKDDDSCNTCGIILDASNPQGLVQMMNIICRTPREHIGCAKLWKIMVDNGVDPNSALFIAWSFNDIDKYAIHFYARGHSWGTPQSLTPGSLWTLAQGYVSEVSLTGAPSAIVNSGLGSKGANLSTLLVSALNKAKAKENGDSVYKSAITDPFAPRAQASRHLTIPEFIEFFIPELVKAQTKEVDIGKAA